MQERFRLNEIINEINGLYHDLSVKLGLSDSESMIFYQLYDNPDSLTQSDIAKATGMSKQTLHSAIRKLEDEGILTLKMQNRKSKTIVVTEYGKEYIRNRILPLVEIEEQILGSWTKSDVQAFLGLQEQFCIQMKKKVDSYGKK